jgi:hypothetical protein
MGAGRPLAQYGVKEQKRTVWCDELVCCSYKGKGVEQKRTEPVYFLCRLLLLFFSGSSSSSRCSCSPQSTGDHRRRRRPTASSSAAIFSRGKQARVGPGLSPSFYGRPHIYIAVSPTWPPPPHRVRERDCRSEMRRLPRRQPCAELLRRHPVAAQALLL